jgi:hypothetical protein
MATSNFTPMPLSSSRTVYLQLDLAGVPWYVYHDRFDAYVRRANTDSCLVLSLAVPDTADDPSVNGVLTLGGASITLAPRPDKEAAAWTKLEGLHGWQHSPGPLDKFVYYAAQAHPSTYYRSVVLPEAEYAIETTPRGEFEVSVRVRVLIGEGERDGTSEQNGRDYVTGGQGVFRLVVARPSGDEKSRGWSVVDVEGQGVQVQAAS